MKHLLQSHTWRGRFTAGGEWCEVGVDFATNIASHLTVRFVYQVWQLVVKVFLFTAPLVEKSHAKLDSNDFQNFENAFLEVCIEIQ